MSEVQYPRNVAAGGRVTGATAALQTGARGITGAVRVSAGLYTVSLAEQIDQIECVAIASLLGSTGGGITCTPQATDGTLTVRTFSGGGGGGWSPVVIGSIDGLTVPGTPTFTGIGVTAISSPFTGEYELTLATAIHLESGASCEGVITAYPIQADAIPPGGLIPCLVRYFPTDTTHVTIITHGLTGGNPILRDGKFGISIWRFAPAPGAAGALVAADLDFSVTVFRLNVGG